jgi:tetraacyldisaccharide 4'-kinase
MGGTGKTPLVAAIASRLVGQGRRVCVISRGYGRSTTGVVLVAEEGTVRVTAREGGDEPVELGRTVPGLSVVVGEKRVEAAAWAAEHLRPDVLLLDDAYQHRWIGRSANILVLDARRDITREGMIPAGRRREPLGGMRRADLVVFARVGEAGGRVPWEERLHRWYRGPVAAFDLEPAVLRDGTTGAARPPGDLAGARVLVLSALGANGQFVATVQDLGTVVTVARGFRDHHRITRREADAVVREAEVSGAAFLVTTGKDLARIHADPEVLRRLTAGPPLVALEVRMRIVRGSADLWRVVDGAAAAKAPQV